MKIPQPENIKGKNLKWIENKTKVPKCSWQKMTEGSDRDEQKLKGKKTTWKRKTKKRGEKEKGEMRGRYMYRGRARGVNTPLRHAETKNGDAGV